MKTCKRNLHQYPAGTRRCPECEKIRLSKWKEKNRDKENKRKAEWRVANKEHQKKKMAEWYQKNKEKVKRKKLVYIKQRLLNDLNFKLRFRLRTRLNHALKKGQKSGSAVSDLGCSISELKTHLETMFQSGMTWENWGKGKNNWNIDHIIPLASFDLTDREQFLKACHYSNLQPLWEKDNLSKSNKLIT